MIRRRPRAMSSALAAALALGPLGAGAGPMDPGGAGGAPSLGDALRDIGAFDASETVDPRLVPPPAPDIVWPQVLIGSGAALAIAGAIGMVASPTCATRDAAERCVDPRGSAPLWPALVVLGLGATVTGSYWYRWTRLPAEDVPNAR